MSLKGVSQKQLALNTGLTEAAISRYISGQREPKAVAIINIVRALDVRADDLLGIKHDEQDGIESALRLVARNANDIPKEKKIALINALLD